eukprot:531013-Rhodomonas_salina.2
MSVRRKACNIALFLPAQIGAQNTGWYETGGEKHKHASFELWRCQHVSNHSACPMSQALKSR